MTTFIGCIEEETKQHIGQVMLTQLWHMILVQILCNKQFFVKVPTFSEPYSKVIYKMD